MLEGPGQHLWFCWLYPLIIYLERNSIQNARKEYSIKKDLDPLWLLTSLLILFKCTTGFTHVTLYHFCILSHGLRIEFQTNCQQFFVLFFACKERKKYSFTYIFPSIIIFLLRTCLNSSKTIPFRESWLKSKQ